MARYTFFKDADPSVLSAQRQKQLQDFANHFGPLASSYGYVDSDVVSILHSLQPDHYFLLDELKKTGLHDLEDPRVDLMPLLLDEGVDLLMDVHYYYPFEMAEWKEEVSKGGIHLAHFRMAMPNHADQVAATLQVCDSANVGEVNSSVESLTITELSAFRFDDSDLLQFRDEPSDVQGFTLGQIAKGFWLDDSEEKWSVASFNKIINKMVELRVNVLVPNTAAHWSQHLSMVCREHLPIAYNMGYRMAASGADIAVVVGRMEKLIAKCTSTIKSNPTLCSAIRRQALVNFCSAFPEGLKLIDASPGELYGCNKGQIHIGSHLDQTMEVFGGPLQAFTFRLANVQDDCRAQIARSLNERGLGFKIEYLKDARSALLMLKMPEVFDGLEHPSPVIQEQGLDWFIELGGMLKSVALSKDWLKRIFTPASVVHYPDVVLLSVVESAITHDLSGDLTAIFRARPQLVAPALDMLMQQDKVNLQFFDAFGFDRHELKIAGNKASSQLIDRQFGADLGL